MFRYAQLSCVNNGNSSLFRDLADLDISLHLSVITRCLVFYFLGKIVGSRGYSWVLGEVLNMFEILGE